MCLSTVSQRFDPPAEEKIVYKIFRKSNGVLSLPVYTSFPLRFGCWLTARRGSAGFGQGRYESGFHAYATRKAAESRICNNAIQVVIPCLFRDITTRGRQYGKLVYVARKMLILMPSPENQNETSK